MQHSSFSRSGRRLLIALAIGVLPTCGNVASAADGATPTASPAPAPATAPSSLATEVQKLEREYAQAQSEFFTTYRQAKTDEQREKVVAEKYPKPAAYAERFIALADRDPTSAAAVDALIWVAMNTRDGKPLDV